MLLTITIPKVVRRSRHYEYSENIMSHVVQLMITCILDTLYPEIGEAVVQVLECLGVQVIFPQEQTCCGQPAFNAGSCAAMLRHGYLELFRDDPAWLGRAKELAGRTYEFTEYLVDVRGVSDVGAHFQGKLAYHASCHLLRELGVDRQPKLLLASLQGAQITELPGAQECCGFGGIFSLEHPDVSAAMLQRKLLNIEESKADKIVSCDAGCMTHINGGLQRQGRPGKVIHIAQLLASAEKFRQPGAPIE
jgi:L-lactate dehydrogenase complex protein LldE